MESVIFEHSPLADYLEGHGEADTEWTSTKTDTSISSNESPSFAPRGSSTAYTKFRRKFPSALKLDIPPARSAVARFHDTCSQIALNSRLGRNDNAQFLEQLRYTIIASQLLNNHTNTFPYSTIGAAPGPAAGSEQLEEQPQINLTWTGICFTAGAAFALAWTAHWVRSIAQTHSDRWSSSLVLCIMAGVATLLYMFFRRQWLLYVRNEALGVASTLVADAQSLDVAISAAITLIQEVELVSRGYRISSPLPPISRLEDQSQTRRCARLRRSLKTSIASILLPYAEAHKLLKPLATEVDLEKYHDIYEITQSDIQEIEELAIGNLHEPEDPETLKSLKISLQRLQIARKLFLCSLLALDADGSKPDFPRWVQATSTMQHLSSISATAASNLEKILSEGDRFSRPHTPKPPLTPGRERVRAQMRKVSTLSHGIRALQAKMHILREESDRALDTSADVAELGSNLLVQYDAIGADLKLLIQEWEEGRAALAVNIDRNERRISLSSAGMQLSRSATPNSLGGVTAVGGGSPTDALKALNGDKENVHGLSSGSDEEVFEAIALPRQRSTLTREERLQKMKEERVRAAIRKEEKDASGNMLKELETVIKLRPRGRTTGRMVSVS
ncbi:hypothetical protein MMC30_000218 [Trapelia coarctata]|nr:hypothetical protein [Trapelia coarctata]